MATIESRDGDLQAAQARIAVLEQENTALRERLVGLEELLDMYDRLSRAEDRELIEADRTIRAQETLQEMSRRELDEAYATIRTHQALDEGSRHELVRALENIEAERRQGGGEGPPPGAGA